jgi:signal transduction histidine kinase
LSAIAIVGVIGQALIQRHLRAQESDSRVVNVAGTQRYKSQEIVKLSLLIYGNVDHSQFPQKAETLKHLLSEWEREHNGLLHGDPSLDLPGQNSTKIKIMFAEVEPYFQNVLNNTRNILAYSAERGDTVGLHASIRALLKNEALFLEKMDKIVFQFDHEATQRVRMLSTLEYVLFGILLLVIALEIFFIFRPITLQVSQTISQLTASEKNATKLSKEIGALYASLEKSYEQLSIVNQPVENPRLYAKADKGGNVTFIDNPLHHAKDLTSGKFPLMLSDLFPGMTNPDDWMDDVIDVVSDGESWQGEIRYETPSKKDSWSKVIVTPVYNESGEVEELAMMGADVTERKEAEHNMKVKNRSEIEKKINQQKFRSVLILEGQEEERKRIAMDIHDGIGQMLTSLKFQIESIDLESNERASEKIREIELLIKDVIREVRKVTFNLKPTVLGDFGLQAALKVFTHEIGKLTEIKLEYRTSGEIDRLPQKIENNIFRIIQEAINNAIKYSGADRIIVDLSQVDGELIVTVSDEGKGFDTGLVEARNMNIESGRGFFNMYERTEYVNGKLFIDTKPGQGTVVKLTVPVRNSILSE